MSETDQVPAAVPAALVSNVRPVIGQDPAVTYFMQRDHRRQLRAMVRNQNSHWVEMQKEIAKLQKRSSETEKTCEEVQRLVNWTEETDNYLQNYLPSEMYSEMHRAMQATLASAPLKMRLDQIEFSQLRMQEAMEKISRVGTFN